MLQTLGNVPSTSDGATFEVMNAWNTSVAGTIDNLVTKVYACGPATHSPRRTIHYGQLRLWVMLAQLLGASCWCRPESVRCRTKIARSLWTASPDKLIT